MRAKEGKEEDETSARVACTAVQLRCDSLNQHVDGVNWAQRMDARNACLIHTCDMRGARCLLGYEDDDDVRLLQRVCADDQVYERNLAHAAAAPPTGGEYQATRRSSPRLSRPSEPRRSRGHGAAIDTPVLFIVPSINMSASRGNCAPARPQPVRRVPFPRLWIRKGAT